MWSAAMLFFQLTLLAGYTYAHISIRYLKPRAQMIVHIALLVISLLLLPILPSPSWRPVNAGDPTLRILELLTATIGLPVFSSFFHQPFITSLVCAPLHRGRALSAICSVEFRLHVGAGEFSIFSGTPAGPRIAGVFLERGVCRVWTRMFHLGVEKQGREKRRRGRARKRKTTLTPASPTTTLLPAVRPGLFQLVFWVLLAACASVLLISVTNHMSENVAPIPLLWVLPLALYLLSFIFAFESDRIYQRWLFIPLLIAALGGMAYMIYANEGNLNIKQAIPGFAGALFVCCMFCHGELARRRPAARYLTLFYLMVSLGGRYRRYFCCVHRAAGVQLLFRITARDLRLRSPGSHRDVESRERRALAGSRGCDCAGHRGLRGISIITSTC